MAREHPHRIGSSDRPDWPLAVIVGAGGMGTAVARRLGQSHRLLIADRDEGHVTALAAALRAEGHDASPVACDVTSPRDIAGLARAAEEAGPVRALAMVVGLSPSMGDFEAIMAVNLVGASMIAEVFRGIVAPGGCGVFISSSAAHMRPAPDELAKVLDAPLEPDFIARVKARTDGAPASAYMYSKIGLMRLCRREAAGWGARGARIVSLSPGLIATPMGAMEFERSPQKHGLLAATPLAREGTMIEIAGVVEFLVSDRASFISGTDILVDGGMIGALQYASPHA